MDSSMVKIDILLTGVGGQGVVLAGDVLGDVALEAGYDVKKTDTLGMAQRGGSVVAHIRLAGRVASPLISRGQADFLVAFEKLEALRWLDYLTPGATVIINDEAIPPLAVSRSEAAYPGDDDIKRSLERHASRVYFVDGPRLTDGLGNRKTLNILLLGALSACLPFALEVWRAAISRRLPPKLAAINLAAFEAGRRAVLGES
jgi:indolepyruvate ferredoxin oxidoreductase, beta subunit